MDGGECVKECQLNVARWAANITGVVCNQCAHYSCVNCICNAKQCLVQSVEQCGQCEVMGQV